MASRIKRALPAGKCSECPNIGNDFHECTEYCFERWASRSVHGVEELEARERDARELRVREDQVAMNNNARFALSHVNEINKGLEKLGMIPISKVVVQLATGGLLSRRISPKSAWYWNAFLPKSRSSDEIG